MSDVTVYEMPKLPAEYAEFFEQESNIAPRETVPTLNPSGKRWTIIADGDSKLLTRKDADGDEVPLQIFRGFIVGHSQVRGRTYYGTAYDPKKPGRPTCWSEDNQRPDERVPAGDKQAKTCASCPMSVKGSQVSDDGRDTKACKEHLLLALVPNRHIGEYPPLRLKLSITSIYDGKQPEREQTRWFSWTRYLEHLFTIMPQSVHTARVLTKIKFDSATEWPKLLFQAERQVETEEAIPLIKLMKEQKDTIHNMISRLVPIGGGTLPAPDVDDAKSAENSEPEKPRRGRPPGPTPTRKPAVDEDGEPLSGKAAAAVEAKAQAARDVTPKPKPKVVDPDEDAEVPAGMRAKKSDPDDEDAPAKPNGKAVKADDDAPPPPTTPGKGNIKALLKDWD